MILKDEQATSELGARIASSLHSGDVITLSGPLGVGKTALARGVLERLGHRGEVPSPSFAIVQPYDDLDPPVWHVDLFRIEDRSELGELGLEAADEGVLLVEWPERAGSSTWTEALELTLDFAEGGARRLTAVVPPSWQSRWPPV
jgi:tRNA threonylcarbamoyladenosine biosynthesis protein TsaE